MYLFFKLLEIIFELVDIPTFALLQMQKPSLILSSYDSV